MTIEQLLGYIGLDKVYSHIEDILNFYFKPLKFFATFFGQSTKDKVLQTLTYVILVLSIGYVLIEEITIRELAKALIFELAILLNIILTLTLSDWILAKVCRRKLNTENIIFFTILTKLLLAPFQIVFFWIVYQL